MNLYSRDNREGELQSPDSAGLAVRASGGSASSQLGIRSLVVGAIETSTNAPAILAIVDSNIAASYDPNKA